MRAIHCRRCGSEWEFPEGIEIPARCPYCGVGIEGHFRDDRDALAYICQAYGYDILQDSTRLDELMEQYVEETCKYSKALRVVIREGIGWDFYHSYRRWKCTDDSFRLKMAEHKLRNDLCLREEVCHYIVDCFTYAYKNIEPDREKSYKDKSDVYMELADTLAGFGMEEEAECLYRVSLDTGNENAYFYYHEPEDEEDYDTLLEQAEDFYYGYGCDEDVEMAIRYIVQYFEKTYCGIDMRTESHRILEDEALENLIDYCEEELRCNDSDYALDVIKGVADILGVPKAYEIVADYYREEDKFWRDSVSGVWYERRVCIEKLKQEHPYNHKRYCREKAREFEKRIKETNYAEAWPIWEKLAELNIGMDAPYGMIGVGYYCGSDGIPIDREKGFYWMKRYYDDVQARKYEETPMLVETEYFMAVAYLLGLGTKQDILRGEELFESVVYKAGPEHIEFVRMCGNCFLLGEVQGTSCYS